jgi:phospholipase C
LNRLPLKFALCAVALGVAACNGGSSLSPLSPGTAPFAKRAAGSTPIQHVIVIVQENRTFNNLFAAFPGATGSTTGYELVNGSKKKINLTETPLTGQRNLNHGYGGFLTACNYSSSSGCQMDDFNDVTFPTNGRTEKAAPYVYVNPADIGPYWTLASTYGLANAMFQTQGSASFTAHQDLIRGGTFIDASHSLIDNPPYGGAWGCDSGHGTKTSLITTNLQLERAAGPFPCTSDFPDYGSNGYKTLRDLLDAKSVSWKYYTPQLNTSGAIWNAFDVIAAVRYGSEWGTNVNWPDTNVFNDISSGSLPAVSWVIPDEQNSDHPHNGSDTGPSWVASIVNAIGQSYYWNSCAIVVVWDDWGGFYDPVSPPHPRDNQGGPGFRVPMLLVSPYSKIGSGSQGGYVSNTVYGFGSIVRFVEDTFNLGRLGTTDSTSNSIVDMLNFNQSPRQFNQVGSKYSRSYFLKQKPSGRPIDTE